MRRKLIPLLVFAAACGRSKPSPEPPASSETLPASSAVAAPSNANQTPLERDGVKLAAADLARGVLGYRETGSVGYTEGPKIRRYTVGRILQRDFGVSLVTDPPDAEGCVRGREHNEKAELNRAYNAVMIPAPKKRHGADVISVATERASQENRRLDDLLDKCREGADSACGELGIRDQDPELDPW